MNDAILITGYNGEIGTQTLLTLSQRQIPVIALDINKSDIKYDNVIYLSLIHI